MTITLAQAAVFLVRITKAPLPVQAVVNLDPPVVAHYLKMSIDLLESADISETRLSTYLAKTIREISRAAGISGIGTVEYDDQETGTGELRSHVSGVYPGQVEGEPEITSFDLENFLQIENQFDLGYLLGLPGDNSVSMSNGMNGVMGNGYTGEFGFGISGLSSDTA